MANANAKTLSLLLLVAIIVVAGATYFIGDSWGLPVMLHPDEAKIVETAIVMFYQKSFEPTHFIWPAHLEMKLNILSYALHSVITGTPFSVTLSTHREAFYLIARAITSLFSIGCIILAFLIGRKQSNRTAVFSAFLVAFFPIYQTHSHYATPDMPTVFFILLLILFSMMYMERPSIKMIVLMSLTTSCFIATKYTGAILCVMIAISIIASSIRDKRYLRIVQHGALAIVLVVSFLFLLSPVLFIQWENVYNALTFLSNVPFIGPGEASWGNSVLYYFTNYINEGGALLLLFLAIGGALFLKNKATASRNIPLFFGFVYWVCLCFTESQHERWGVPMYVSPLLLAAWGMDAALSFLAARKASRKSFKLLSYACYLCMGLTALNFLTGSAARLTPFLLQDTRAISMAYCEENNISIANTTYDGYTPLSTSGGKGTIERTFVESDGAYYLKNSRHQYILLSSGIYENHIGVPGNARGDIYRYILDNFNPIHQLEPATARSNSPVEALNIFRNLENIMSMNQVGFSGPRLLFYEATPENYLPYQWGDDIVFDGDAANYDQFYISGLDNQAPGGCWSAGGETEFLFYAPIPEGALSLSFRVTPFLSETTSFQRVRLMANDKEIDRWEISQEGTYTAVLPKGTMDTQALSLRFEYLNITGPGAVSNENHEKTPSLFFQEMVLNCEVDDIL